MAKGGVPGRDALVAEAQARTGLTDFGDPWLLDNLAALIPFIDSEAELTPEGTAAAAETLIHALVNRLRHVDFVKKNPAIRDEKVEVAAVVVGLPRTGSTLMHRMLAASPGMTAARWWEVNNYVPFPGEAPGDPTPRIDAARAQLDWMLEHAPDLMSIHPMSVDQPDEEVMIQGQLFSGTMPEASWFVPGYARWLMEHSRTRNYADLKEALQSLQWQDKSRHGRKWVLKTPGHLMALDAVIDTFPDAKIVMTHRDPVQTVPSYCSMMASLYHMVSTVPEAEIARFWKNRLKELIDRFMKTRADTLAREPGSTRFIDVRFTDVMADPIAQGRRVLEQAGARVTPETTATMEEWLEENRRDARAPHKYSLEEFGLDRKNLEALFADYRQQFIL